MIAYIARARKIKINGIKNGLGILEYNLKSGLLCEWEVKLQ